MFPITRDQLIIEFKKHAAWNREMAEQLRGQHVETEYSDSFDVVAQAIDATVLAMQKMRSDYEGFVWFEDVMARQDSPI